MREMNVICTTSLNIELLKVSIWLDIQFSAMAWLMQGSNKLTAYAGLNDDTDVVFI